MHHEAGFGLYVHIPFCLQKCRYCSFNSIPLPESAEVDRYLKALERELSMISFLSGRYPESVYIGGGTPSILSESQLTSLFDAVHSAVDVDSTTEITVEANPGTAGKDKVEHLASLGVNRVSLGIQSFDDRVLHLLGRSHTAAEAFEAFEAFRKAGFRNIGIDLIYGLPGQRIEDWGAVLSAALALQPEHLSLYGLALEEGTPLHRDQSAGRIRALPDDTVNEMYHTAVKLTDAAGFEHYEISNWARPGYRSRHNIGCWSMKAYYGAGAGAHSFVRSPSPVRSGNLALVHEYVRILERGELPADFREDISADTLSAEALMLGLRLREGISRGRFRDEFGGDPFDLFPRAMELGTRKRWLEETGGRLRLTQEGIIFSDELFLRLF